MKDDPRYDPKEFRRRRAPQDNADLLLALAFAVALIVILNIR